MSEQPDNKGSLESRQTKSEADIGSLIIAFRDFQADFKSFVRSVSDRGQTQWPTLIGVVALGVTMLGFAVLALRNEMADKDSRAQVQIEVMRTDVESQKALNMQLALEYIKQGH